jgi:hypothetical protein
LDDDCLDPLQNDARWKAPKLQRMLVKTCRHFHCLLVVSLWLLVNSWKHDWMEEVPCGTSDKQTSVSSFWVAIKKMMAVMKFQKQKSNALAVVSARFPFCFSRQ